MEKRNELQIAKGQFADSRRVSLFSLMSQIGIYGKQMVAIMADYLRYAHKYDLPNETPNQVDEIEQKRKTGENAANAFMWIAIIGAAGLTYLTVAYGMFSWPVIIGITLGLVLIIYLSERGLAESGFIALGVDPMKPISIRIVRWLLAGGVAVFVVLVALFLLSRVIELPFEASFATILITIEIAAIVLYALCHEYEKFHSWQFRLAQAYQTFIKQLAESLGLLFGYSDMWRNDSDLKETVVVALEELKVVAEVFVLVPVELKSSKHAGEASDDIQASAEKAPIQSVDRFGRYENVGEQAGASPGNGQFGE